MMTAMGDSVMNLCLAWKTDAVVQTATTWQGKAIAEEWAMVSEGKFSRRSSYNNDPYSLLVLHCLDMMNVAFFVIFFPPTCGPTIRSEAELY